VVAITQDLLRCRPPAKSPSPIIPLASLQRNASEGLLDDSERSFTALEPSASGARVEIAAREEDDDRLQPVPLRDGGGRSFGTLRSTASMGMLCYQPGG
jgi:hypothetical protein